MLIRRGAIHLLADPVVMIMNCSHLELPHSYVNGLNVCLTFTQAVTHVCLWGCGAILRLEGEAGWGVCHSHHLYRRPKDISSYELFRSKCVVITK